MVYFGCSSCGAKRNGKRKFFTMAIKVIISQSLQRVVMVTCTIYDYQAYPKMARIIHSKSCRLCSMLAITGSFFLVEIIVGYLTNSMALVADSFHMLSDVVALLVGLFSVRIAKKKTSKNTFGWVRAEVVGALVNSVFLLALCFSILVESVKRLIEIERIKEVNLLLYVGIAGLVVNVLGLILFGSHGHSHGGGSSHGHSHGSTENNTSGLKSPRQLYRSAKLAEELTDDEDEEEEVNRKPSLINGSVIIQTIDDGQKGKGTHLPSNSSQHLNMRAVFLHVLGDALGSVIVVISAIIIMHVEGEWKYYIDPGMSILMVTIILSTTIPLFKEAALILLQTVPTHIQVDALQDRLLKDVTGILGIHEFHIWQLAGRRIIASAHIRCHNLKDYMRIANEVKEFFHNEGIHSTTIQPEFVDEEETIDNEKVCVLKCGIDAECEPNTCCGPKASNVGDAGANPNDIRQRTCSSVDESTQINSEIFRTAILSDPALTTIT